METPYYQAARHPTKSAVGKAYTPLQQIIKEVECELSAYRLFVPTEHKWYVVVIGARPGEEIIAEIKTVLWYNKRCNYVSRTTTTNAHS